MRCSTWIDPEIEAEEIELNAPRFSEFPTAVVLPPPGLMSDARQFAREERPRAALGWFDALPVPAALVTSTGEIAAASPSLADLAQAPNTLIGTPFTSLLWPESRTLALAVIMNSSGDIHGRKAPVEVTLTSTGRCYQLHVGAPLGHSHSGMRIAVLTQVDRIEEYGTGEPAGHVQRPRVSGSIPAPSLNPQGPLRALAGLPLPAFITVDGKVGVVTQRASLLLGLPAESLEDTPLDDLVGAGAARELLEQCHAESTKWQPQALPALPVRIGGSIRACACCHIPFGRPGVGLVLLECWGGSSLELPKENSRQSSASYLIAGVAHEINNPLTFIVPTLTELLGEFVARREQLRAHPVDAWTTQLEEALEGVSRIASVVQNLRAAREATPDAEPTLVNQVIVNTLRLAAASMPQNVAIRRDLGLVAPAHGNRQRLGQVVLNLVLNAAHALTDGARDGGTIFVRSWSDSRHTWLEVRDNGPGVPAELRDKIFEPFFTTRATGSGLGLAVCRAMIRELGGELTLEALEAPGACFRVRLPLWQASGERELVSTGIASSERSSVKPRKCRVLLVDDDPPVRRALRRMLSTRHQVSEAGSLQEALTLAERTEFDILVTDLVMSHGGGPELIEQLKLRGSPLANHVIVISGMAPDATPSEYPRLTKPCNADELLQTIERIAQ
jgi:nitrogen-specific signal transduction histidine kinase/CheY-like chemotaxis protein